VTVNIYTGGVTFSRVQNAYIRLCVAQGNFYDTGHELARFPLGNNIKTRGLVFAKLVRRGPHWVFEALAQGCGGSTAASKETMDVVKGKYDPVHQAEGNVP
jgi:stress response protein SCP2